jgi:pimeloyl-ACP methyl ester carboxylesterase
MIGAMSSDTMTRRPRRRRGPLRVRVRVRARRLARYRVSHEIPGPRSRGIVLRDGRTLGFDDFGDPLGTPVLFFHGFGSSRVVRHPDDDIAAQLGARVIAVDRPGIGMSTRQAGRRLSDWPRDVAELLDQLGIERCALVGWSGGGPYALACAWQMPQRVSVIGLISCPAPLSGAPGGGYLWRRHRAMSRTAEHAPWVIALAMWQWSRQQRSDPAKQLDEAIAGMVAADREILGDPALRAVMLANAAEMYRQGKRGIYDEALCMARPWGFPIAGVSVPVRIWHGVQDRAVPVGMARYLERVINGAVATYFPHEGHHFMYDRWREILGVIVAEARAREGALPGREVGGDSPDAVRPFVDVDRDDPWAARGDQPLAGDVSVEALVATLPGGVRPDLA